MKKRRFALAFLLFAALALAAASRVPATEPANGLDVSIVAGMVERVDVHPVGPIAAADVLPGEPGALGRTTLKDWTRRPLLVRLRGLPVTRDLDDTVRVSVRLGDHPIANTTLGRLRALSAPVRIEAAVPVELSVRAWLPQATA